MPSSSLGNTSLSRKPIFEDKVGENAPSPLNSVPPDTESLGTDEVLIRLFDDFWCAWRDDSATSDWVYLNSIATS